MPFNVDTFISSIATRGALKTNKFELSLTLPAVFNGDPNLQYYRTLIMDQGLWCDRASIPGLFLQTLKFRRYGYGPLDTVPVTSVFNDVQVSIICDSMADNWRMMTKWLNKINNTDSSRGMWSEVTEVSNNARFAPYELAYQEDYSTDVDILVYNDVGEVAKVVTLAKAFPSAVSDIKLDWGDNGDLARFIVNISYQDWNSSDVLDDELLS